MRTTARTAGPTPATALGELIRNSRSTVALTGAGISVPSGIPDFRTPGTGMWTKVDPMKVAHIDAFRRDPKAFWKYYRPRFETLANKVPNGAHRALAALEGLGLLDGVITQNIDRLHGAAGSKRIVEVHGTIATSSCTCCGVSYALEQVEKLFTDEGVAECRMCCGLVKPDVVLFGEMLPPEAMDDALELAEGADLMLCIGTSLEVHPVAGLPGACLDAGGKLAIITQSPTPFDREATVRLDGDVVDDLADVLAAIRA